MAHAQVPDSVRVGYGLGSFFSGTFSTVPGLLLLYYLTNALDVSPGIAGLVVFVPKAWDLLINPYVGRLSDRTVSRYGPRRRWILVGAMTLPACFALIFAGPPLRGGWAAGYVFVAFMLASTAYAFFEVPYKCMPAEMTNDYHEQSRVLTYRMAFLGMAILLSGAGAPIIISQGGEDPTIAGYRVMGLVIGGVLLAAGLATFLGTAKAPRVTEATAEASLRAQLAAARGNTTFRWLLAFSCAQMLAAGMMLAGAPYFATYVIEDIEATTTLFLALVGPIVVIMPLWVWLSRRLDKRAAMRLSSLLFLIGAVGLAFTQVLGAGYAHACVVVVGVGYAGIQLLQFSMLADTLMADVLVSGKRRAGVFTGLWTAAETVVFALGGMMLGWLLSLAGFVSSAAGRPVPQPDSAVTAVLYGGTLLPAAAIALAMVMISRYDLTMARMAELRAVSPRVGRPG